MIDFASVILLPPRFISICNQDATAAILLAIVWSESARNSSGWCELTIGQFMERTSFSEERIRSALNALIKAKLVTKRPGDVVALRPNRSFILEHEFSGNENWDSPQENYADKMAEMQQRVDGVCDARFLAGGREMKTLADLVAANGEYVVLKAWENFLQSKEDWCAGHPLHIFLRHFTRFVTKTKKAPTRKAQVESLLRERVNGR